VPPAVADVLSGLLGGAAGASTLDQLAGVLPARARWALARISGSAGADIRDTLGLDSLDFLNFVEMLSQRPGQRIDEDDYPKLATLASASALVAGR
jgi:acyl carrier protein